MVTDPGAAPAPLAGVRVLDLTDVLAGRTARHRTGAAGQLMAP